MPSSSENEGLNTMHILHRVEPFVIHTIFYTCLFTLV